MTVTPVKDKKAASKSGARKTRTYMPAAERRASIIAAAQQVFARSNLKGARTRDIASAAAVNQATIFEHFASKEALFQEAVVQPLLDMMRGMEARRETYETADTADSLAQMAQASAGRHVQNMLDIFPLLTAALFSDPDIGRDLYREHIMPILQQRGQILDGLVREGLDLEFVGLAIFGITFAVALDQHFSGREPANLDELTRQFTRMATGGFAGERIQHNNEGE